MIQLVISMYAFLIIVSISTAVTDTTLSSVQTLSKTELSTTANDRITTNHQSTRTVSTTTSNLIATTDQIVSTNHNTNTNLDTKANQTKADEQSVLRKSILPPYLAPNCSSSNLTGLHCNLSTTTCDMLQPCLNNASCMNDHSAHYGYHCSCAFGFNGTNCELDHRPCKPTTCWNNGTCSNVSDTSFSCSCVPGWEGNQCERMINFCTNVTCLNRGVCRPLLLDYKCECLGQSDSGRHCEKTSSSLNVRQIVIYSCISVAITIILVFIFFTVGLDLLKYAFGVGPAREERKRLRAERLRLKRGPPVTQRFVHVNAPISQANCNTQDSSV